MLRAWLTQEESSEGPLVRNTVQTKYWELPKEREE